MKNLLMFLLLGTALFSCIKHEVIPPPLPQVDLQASFSADTNGTQIAYVLDVNGFVVESTNFKEINTSPQPSNITYFSTIRSTNLQDLFKVSLGRASWDVADGISPPVNQFRIFFESKVGVNLDFSEEGVDGVELQWRDSNNQLWTTDPDSPTSQFFTLTSVSQESDEDGDYLLFTAIFTATFYSPDGSQSKRLENGVFTSYFQNN
jgi:hypothetical protein